MPRKPKERKPVTGGVVTVKATITSHDNKALPEPIPFNYSYVVLGDKEPIPDDEDLNDEDRHDVVNAERRAKAMAKARNTELENAGLIVSKFSDPDAAFDGLVKIYMLQLGMSKEDATAEAESKLGKRS